MNANLPTSKLLAPQPVAKPDIVRRFLAWAQSADADARAEGASALARAYLHSGLAPPLRAEAALAMMALLDDPSIVVRQALAEALCRAREAPRAVILALAADDPEAAAPVIQYSPVLTDADLVACATNGDLAARMALARRPNLARQAAAALAETGEHDAVLSLIGNLDVDLPAELLGRILTRFNDDASVRDALLARAALPANLRARIAVAAAKDLSIEASLWMPPERAEHLAREARDQAICSIASSCEKDERAELARALRTAGALTPALLLRSLLGGERTLFAAAMAELSGLPLPRVAGFMLKPRAQGFAALARRAGLKKSLMPAFCAALEASKTYLGRDSWRRAQIVAGAKGHRGMRAARRSHAHQSSGAAVALRGRGGEDRGCEFRARGLHFRFRWSATANPELFSGQRRRPVVDLDSGFHKAFDAWDTAGAQRAICAAERGSDAACRIAARVRQPARRRGLSSTGFSHQELDTGAAQSSSGNTIPKPHADEQRSRVPADQHGHSKRKHDRSGRLCADNHRRRRNPTRHSDMGGHYLEAAQSIMSCAEETFSPELLRTRWVKSAGRTICAKLDRCSRSALRWRSPLSPAALAPSPAAAPKAPERPERRRDRRR